MSTQKVIDLNWTFYWHSSSFLTKFIKQQFPKEVRGEKVSLH